MGRTKVYAETERQRHKRFEKQLEELRSGISNKLRYQKRKQQEEEADAEIEKIKKLREDWEQYPNEDR
jgi:hypothetical protein